MSKPELETTEGLTKWLHGQVEHLYHAGDSDCQTVAYLAECVRLRERARGLYDRAVFTKNDLETLATAEDDKYFGDYLQQIEFGCPWDASASIDCCGHHVLSAQQHRIAQNERLRVALDTIRFVADGRALDLWQDLRNAMRGDK